MLIALVLIGCDEKDLLCADATKAVHVDASGRFQETIRAFDSRRAECSNPPDLPSDVGEARRMSEAFDLRCGMNEEVFRVLLYGPVLSGIEQATTREQAVSALERYLELGDQAAEFVPAHSIDLARRALAVCKR